MTYQEREIFAIAIFFVLGVVLAVWKIWKQENAQRAEEPRQKPKRREGEGFRRLSWFCGWLGIIAWIVFLLGQTAPGDAPVSAFVLLLVLGAIPAFFFPWALIRGLRWVIEGFKLDRKES